MYQYEYPHPAVTTDIVIFTIRDKQLKLLLIKRGGEPYKGKWRCRAVLWILLKAWMKVRGGSWLRRPGLPGYFLSSCIPTGRWIETLGNG